jgi:hypothetical protein
MGRVSDKLLVIIILGAAALAYVFHEIVKDAVDQWLAVRLADFGGVFAGITERMISLTLTSAFGLLIVWALYLRIHHEFEDDLKERLRPKFACSFAMTDSNCVHESVVRSARPAAGTSVSANRMTSFRLKVAADRIGSVDGCRGRLVSIRRDHETVLDGERLVLPFLPATGADAAGKRIDASVPEFLEFLQISDRNTVDVPQVTRSNAINVTSLMLQPGDYTFVIIISSPESAATVTPVLHWTGDRKTASVTL